MHLSIIGHFIFYIDVKTCTSSVLFDIKYIDIAQYLTNQWAKMCNALDFSKSDQNRTQAMYIFGHISVKQRQLPDQHVDSGP